MKVWLYFREILIGKQSTDFPILVSSGGNMVSRIVFQSISYQNKSYVIEGSPEMLGTQWANVALSFMAGEQMMEA